MHAFWEIVASNAMLVAVLAVGVAVLGRAWKNPTGLHILWVLVLLKLFTPPLITIGVPFPADALVQWMFHTNSTRFRAMIGTTPTEGAFIRIQHNRQTPFLGAWNHHVRSADPYAYITAVTNLRVKMYGLTGCYRIGNHVSF